MQRAVLFPGRTYIVFDPEPYFCEHKFVFGVGCEIRCVNSLSLAKPTLSHSCIVFTRHRIRVKMFQKCSPTMCSNVKMFTQLQMTKEGREACLEKKYLINVPLVAIDA